MFSRGLSLGPRESSAVLKKYGFVLMGRKDGWRRREGEEETITQMEVNSAGAKRGWEGGLGVGGSGVRRGARRGEARSQGQNINGGAGSYLPGCMLSAIHEV